MSGPRFDEIEGEEEAAPPFDAIEEAVPSPAQAPSVAPDGPVLRAPARSTWNTLRSVAEATGTVPQGIIPDEGTARGAVASILQGPTNNWADETAGLLGKRDALLRHMVQGGQKPNPEQAYKDSRDDFRHVEGAFRKENPAAAFALTTASGLLAPTPRGSMSPAFSSRFASALVPGAVAGAGAADEEQDMLEAATVAAPFSAGGQAAGEVVGDVIGYGLGRVGQWAGNKVAAAETKAGEMAAEKVAKEVASAKGKLGATTQEANRAVENLTRLQQVGGLSPAQQQELATLKSSGVLSALHEKLADSMLEQVPGAANRISRDRLILEALVQNAGANTQQATDDILSGAEAKRQVSERLKRYLPTVIGAAAGADKQGILGGAIAGYALGGTPGSAFVGGLSGSALRPAIRAVGRMATHPAVQSMAFTPVQRGADALGATMAGAIPPIMSSAARTQRNEVEAHERRDTSTSDVVSGVLSENPKALGPYAAQLEQAAAAGTLPLLHYTLQQKDPEYRRLLDSIRSGGTQ